MKFNELIKREEKKEYYQNLQKYIKSEYQNYICYPSFNNIYKSFEYTDIDTCKVIILGQDPYHEENQAMGLAFSVPSSVKCPPSLINIFKEIEIEYGVKHTSGDLTYLAKQGVLLLNTILTVRKGEPLSHANKGWEILTDEIIKCLDLEDSPKVFILLGSNAIKKEVLIKNSKHLIIKNVHPSPLSAYRGFFNSSIFIKTNQFLKNNNIEEIKW